MLLLVLAVVRDHGAGGVGEGVVLLVRSIGETDTEEQQKDEFGSRVLVISTTSVMALPILWNSVKKGETSHGTSGTVSEFEATKPAYGTKMTILGLFGGPIAPLKAP